MNAFAGDAQMKLVIWKYCLRQGVKQGLVCSIHGETHSSSLRLPRQNCAPWPLRDDKTSQSLQKPMHRAAGPQSPDAGPRPTSDKSPVRESRTPGSVGEALRN